MTVPEFDELYVISDLHLGGPAGRQIFTSTAAASAFLATLTQAQGRRVGLVINGDLVDFLAEDNAACFDPATAEQKLAAIAARPAFRPVFDGLQSFVSVPDHHLIINLGNHDLELALPGARRQLVALLSQGSDAAAGRIALVFDGTGVVAQVGAQRILCLHGNEVDAWNVTDFERLRRIARDGNEGREVDAWRPNAGSRMVVEVMNAIKVQWPFVDLLKPETEAVPLVLLSLNPSYAGKLKEIAGFVAVAQADALRMRAGFLGEPDKVEPPVAVNPLIREAAGIMTPSSREARGVADVRLLDEIEASFRQNRQPMDLLTADFQGEYLGKLGDQWDRIVSWFREEKQQALRRTLSRIVDPELFSLTKEDATYTQIMDRVGPEIDVVITGHTHLDRAIPRAKGGMYYNSGTWAGLMQLTTGTLGSDEAFAQVYGVLSQGTLAALEQAHLVRRPNTVVALWKTPAGQAAAELRHVWLDGGQLVQAPVIGSAWPVPLL